MGDSAFHPRIIIAAVILILLGRGGHLDSLFYSDEELELIQQQSN